MIVALGTDDEIFALAGDDAATIDAGGRLVLPGFVDPHLQVPEAGVNATLCVLTPGECLATYEWDADPLTPFGTIARSVQRARQAVPDVARAVKLVTLDAAYALGMDHQVGSLMVGKQADFVIVDQNIFEVGVPAIDGSRVLLTVLAGQPVNGAPPFAEGSANGSPAGITVTLDVPAGVAAQRQLARLQALDWLRAPYLRPAPLAASGLRMSA